MIRWSASAVLMLLVAASLPARETPPPLAVYDEATLREAGFDTDAANLLNVLRQHAGAVGDQRRIKTLIAQLGSPQFEERESAARELIAIGQPTLAVLQEAQRKYADAEVRRRVEDLIALLEREQDANGKKEDRPCFILLFLSRRSGPCCTSHASINSS